MQLSRSRAIVMACAAARLGRRKMRRQPHGVGLLVVGCLLSLTSAASAQTPLHARIDALVAAGHVGSFSPPAHDADFVRRVYLDLVGMVPTSAEVRAFLADATPDKRARLIDQLLASPRHARHMAKAFDVMLMERRANKHVPAAEWEKYLYESFLSNKPYDVLAREILSSDGTDPALRPAAKFLLDREAEPNLLTRDTGRIFFGHDYQCAQCHDHPLVNDYYQADYYGLYAFFSRTQLFAGADKVTVLMDNATGEVSYQSVFDPAGKGNTLPRVPGGRQVEEPRFNPGEEWTVAPAKDVRHVPKYSRRAQLAVQAVNPANRQFNRNIVNRLWAQMMGRGLVEPVDLHHSGNPPTHPELLELLADEFVAMKYDVQAFIRELALSQTYQRSIDMPADLTAAAAAAKVPTLEESQKALAAAAEQSLAGLTQVGTELFEARKAIPPIIDEATKALAPLADVQKEIAAAGQALAEAQAALNPKQEIAKVVVEAATKTKEAAAKAPQEQDLAAAATVFQTRADQLNAEVAALVKAVEEKSAAAKAAGDKLVAIQQAAAPINTRLDAARQQVIALEERQHAAASKSHYDRALKEQVERQISEAKALGEYAAALAKAQAAQAVSQKLVQDLEAAKAMAAKLSVDLPQLQAAVASAEKANGDAQAALAAAKRTLDAREAARKEFADVLAKAEAASQALPKDTELAQATARLKSRSEQVTAEHAAAQSQWTAMDEAAKAAASQLAAATQAMTNAAAQSTSLAQRIAALEAQQAPAAQQAAADAQTAQRLADEVPDRWSRLLATRGLRQLSPEQFGWSIVQAAGVYHNYVLAAAAEIEKASPLSEAAKSDPAQLAARQRQVDEAVYAKLAPNISTFVQLFGAGAGQPQSDFFATVDQALFLANGGVVKSWLVPSGENLGARLLKLEDPKQLAEELYLSVLTRLPTEAEIAEVTEYLAARPTEKPAVVQELAWALIGSAEFRFNH